MINTLCVSLCGSAMGWQTIQGVPHLCLTVARIGSNHPMTPIGMNQVWEKVDG